MFLAERIVLLCPAFLSLLGDTPIDGFRLLFGVSPFHFVLARGFLLSLTVLSIFSRTNKRALVLIAVEFSIRLY